MLVILREFFVLLFLFGTFVNAYAEGLSPAPRAAICSLLLWLAWLCARWSPGDDQPSPPDPCEECGP